MVTFVFPPDIQQGIISGAYEIVRNSATGELIGLARNKVTGQFVGHAVKTVVNNGFSLNPITSSVQPLLSLVEMYQIHTGFAATLKGISEIQASLGVLQATTAAIGVGTCAIAVLAAVNIWQTLQLKQDIKHLKLQVRDGFIDLKQALQSQGDKIIDHIDFVAQDIKFEQHRLELIKAYGRFLEASKLIKIALSCNDISIRNADLANARQTLSEALAIYNNPHLLSEISAVGQLRRLECAWTIDHTITLTYQLQNERNAVIDRLSHLQETIRQDCLRIIDNCIPKQEISFLFPELAHIYHHDLVALESWKNQVNWLSSLPASEVQNLTNLEINNNTPEESSLTPPDSLTQYETLQQQSHPISLRDQLKCLFSPHLRCEYETYINQQAQQRGYAALVPSTLEKASDFTVINLYWYFKDLQKIESK
ncbi:conserved hypothetical protein [Gloeothece citriformis PCC 7424]|uniref:Uncharacterized protein n=1 Tax=Gloeothece citriformis (strain PCC 7424) TaxID=65393 RepID=B7KCQ2_GLOC7|nr:hypothetical protein [Gloeothece citriformis]ACK71603.1 conserved hypothetical protein [Gloeothece citriformis PCC 7424]